MRQIEQNYRNGRLRVVEAPAPGRSPRRNLVATRISLISAGTEKQIIDLARSSLAAKAINRPDLVRKTIDKVRQEGLTQTVSKVMTKLDTPIPLGYSLAGTVLEPGDRAGGYAIGDRVACAGAAVANHADLNAVPKHLMVKVPHGVSDEDASFVTLGAIALQGVRVAQPTLGERIVVMGLGLIGQLTVQLLKANGCRVLGFDPNAERVRLALEMGADAAVADALGNAVEGFTGGIGADAVIVTASTKSSAPVNQAAGFSRMKGRVVIVGLVGLELDREPFYKRELDLRLSMSYGPGRYDPAYEDEGHDYPLPYVRWTEQRNMAAFLDLVAEGRITPSRLVTHRFPIERAAEAYAMLDSDEPYLAVLLTFPDSPVPVERVRAVGAPAQPKAAALGVSFIGFGNYAQAVLLPALRKAGEVALRAVVTRASLSAHSAAEKGGFALAATEAEAAFDDAETQLVCIASRHDSHARLAIAALEAGKHVFVEKPLALSAEELQGVEATARAAPGTLTVGFNRRFAPMLIEAGEAARAGGGPLLMHYRVNAGHVPAESWLHSSEGGGRLVGEGCHFIDALSAIAGADPVSLAASRPEGISDSVQALIRFADGSTGTLLYSSLGDPALPKEEIEIFAHGAVIQVSDFRELVITRGGKARRRKAAQDKGQAALMARVAQAARGDGPAPIALDTLVAVSRATLAPAL